MTINILGAGSQKLKILSISMAIFVAFYIAIFGSIGALTWHYTVNFWLEFFGKPTTFPYLCGFLLGCIPIIGQIVIPFAMLTFIISILAPFFM